jgi:hypothetical protein
MGLERTAFEDWRDLAYQKLQEENFASPGFAPQPARATFRKELCFISTA